jgi:hypothetical protein
MLFYVDYICLVFGQIVKDVKTSEIFNEMEQLINETTATIGKIRKNRETNSSAVREQKILVENEIRGVRTTINNYLDKWCSLQCSLISNTYDGKF